MIKAPITKPIHFVVEAVSGWEIKLTAPQTANLTLLLSSLILLGTLNLTGIATGWLCTFTVNRLHHFFKFANLSIHCYNGSCDPMGTLFYEHGAILL
jgi:hypothetical protein